MLAHPPIAPLDENVLGLGTVLSAIRDSVEQAVATSVRILMVLL